MLIHSILLTEKASFYHNHREQAHKSNGSIQLSIIMFFKAGFATCLFLGGIES